MFEGDKEKYKKFLKNLENALAEADIQKRIREIVEDTSGRFLYKQLYPCP